MPHVVLRGIPAALVCLILNSGAASAHSGLAALRGTVSDASRAVIPGATITFTEPSTGVVVRTAVSDEFGNFEMPDLGPGTYDLQAELPGFKTFVSTAIVLESGQIRRLDVPLQVGGTSEEVTVGGGAAVITSDSGAISARFSAEERPGRSTACTSSHAAPS